MSAFHDNALMGASGQQGYKISRSVRLRSSASAYFNRTPASAGNRKTWTWSDWVKRGTLGTRNIVIQAEAGGNTNAVVEFNSSDQLRFFQQVGSVDTFYLTTTQVFRDPSAWYHLMVVLDTTQATSTNRMKIYVNGVQITSFSSSLYPSQNFDGSFNNNVAQYIGTWLGVPAYFDGYHTEINFIDGQALTPSSFGETNAVTGVWQPKKYTGTYGTNGFYLNFSDNSSNTATTIGKDYSGNGNNWTPNNISVTAGVTYDSMVDSPTVGATSSNYCTLNPIDSVGATISDGNLKYTLAAGTNYTTRSTIGMTSGKWYAEWTWTAGTNSDVGIATSQASLSQYLGQNAYGWIYYNDGNKYTNATGSAYGATYATNDVIGIAFDADNGTLTFYKNGASQGTAFTGLTSGPYFFAIGSANTTGFYNFGQRPFSYTPPTGFVALNTQNLPTPTISNGANYMAATLYTGVDGVAGSVTGVGFSPDFVWVKSRSGANSHGLFDTVRGVQKGLFSNLTNAEISSSTYLTSFDSNGFSHGGAGLIANGNLVSWNWKAGGTGITNTSGSITSTVSAGATQGFSVVTFTGNYNGSTGTGTVGHGLGVAPKMIIIKNRSQAFDWGVGHASIGWTQAGNLNLTNAFGSSAYFNNTAPTSSVFSVGLSNISNQNGSSIVAYCFAEVAGYSKFGSYTGNGNSSDGPFVFCGFRPRFIMIKRTDSAGNNWVILDTSRDTYNAAGLYLYPNLSAAEDDYRASTGPVDILSNGFKQRSTLTNVNASGGTYIFMAVAENPFKLSLAR